MTRWILTAVLVALVSFGPSAPGQAQTTLRAAALVNDDIISVLDLVFRTRLALLSIGQPDTPENRQRLSSQVLRNLIDERLQLQEAERLGIEIEEQEVDQGLARIAATANVSVQQLAAELQRNGIPLEVLRAQVHAQLAWQEVIRTQLASDVDVSEQDVEETVERLSEEVGKTQYRLAEIFLSVDNASQEDQVRQNAERLMQQIRSGAPFRSVASQFSESATAARGGELGWVTLDQLDGDVEAAVRDMEPGSLAGPVRGITGYYILGLLDKRKISGGPPRYVVAQARLPLPADAAGEVIVNAENAAREISQQARGCEGLLQIAQNNQAIEASQEGPVPLQGLAPDVANAVEDLNIGQVSAPIRRARGFLVVALCDAQGGLNEKNIEDRLRQQQLDLLIQRRMRDLRRTANIEIRL